MTRTTRLVSLVVLSIAFAPLAQAQGRARREPIDPAGIARLVGDTGAQVSVHEATGAARFVRTTPGRKLSLLKKAERAASLDAKKDRSAEFFAAYGGVFGIVDPASELEEVRVAKDRQGGTHFAYRQLYRGLPVFAGELRSHFDASDELVAVNGTFVPEIGVDPNPKRTADEAGKTAVAKVEADLGQAGKLSVTGTTLLVFREGLAKGVPGPNHLAWQVEVGDGANVREFVYVDAHTGQVHRPDHRRLRRPVPARLRRPEPGDAAAVLPRLAVLDGGRFLPDRRSRGQQHDPVLAGHLRLLLARVRPRLVRRCRRDHGLDLQPRLLLPERLVERDLHLVLPGSHDRRRDGVTSGPTPTRSTPTTSSTSGSRARSTSPTRTSSARRSTASTAAAATRPTTRARPTAARCTGAPRLRS